MTPQVSDAAVRAKTGKTWTQWFKLLDKAGGRSMDHKQIVAYLAANSDISGWWQQTVTVTYEQSRGLRAKHEKPDGFAVSGSRTVDVPLGQLFKAWDDAKRRGKWLGDDIELTVRKSTPGKSMRITWTKPPSNVDAYFTAKGDAKSLVSVQHSKLKNAREAARLKAFWADALDRMKSAL